MLNLSFAGCGFLGIYHVGVAVCLKQYIPNLMVKKISGASAGAIAACALLCDLPIGEQVNDVLRVVQEARSKTLGPFSPSFNVHNILLEQLEKILPDNAHILVKGKLHISLTRVYDGKNVIVSEFESKKDLMQALLASCFVPVFSGVIPPLFHGVRYMDGGFSDNLPTPDGNTITVSPFCGESDICPRDPSSRLFHINIANTSIELSKENIYRFTKILFPPSVEVLANMCKQGFEDTLRYLHLHRYLSCTRCLEVKSTFVVTDTKKEPVYDPECTECKAHKEKALKSNLPDTILTVFQDAIDSTNKGIVNWLFKHRSMKILSVLSLPCTLPADMVYATFTKLLSATPDVGKSLWLMSKFLMDQVSDILAVASAQHQLSAQVSCHMSLTNYGETTHVSESAESSVSRTNNINFNLTLNYDERTSSSQTPPKPLSKWPSMTLDSQTSDIPMDNDTFDHILQVTAHNESVMAFYYTDEDNKVKVTEIYDVTDADTSAMLSPEERENNTQLEFDGDWDTPLVNTWTSQQNLSDDELYSITGLSDGSLDGDNYDGNDDALDFDHGNIFSDPESEWNADENKSDEQILEQSVSPSDSLPESDQQGGGHSKTLDMSDLHT